MTLFILTRCTTAIITKQYIFLEHIYPIVKIPVGLRGRLMVFPYPALRRAACVDEIAGEL